MMGRLCGVWSDLAWRKPRGVLRDIFLLLHCGQFVDADILESTSPISQPNLCILLGH